MEAKDLINKKLNIEMAKKVTIPISDITDEEELQDMIDDLEYFNNDTDVIDCITERLLSMLYPGDYLDKCYLDD